jgi:hypothetical protein
MVKSSMTVVSLGSLLQQFIIKYILRLLEEELLDSVQRGMASSDKVLQVVKRRRFVLDEDEESVQSECYHVFSIPSLVNR